MNGVISIWPSLLAGDFGRLEACALAAQAAGADALHLDIMDGHFVPNLSMGPDVVRMARHCLDIPINVHLMVARPDKFVEVFIKAGATTLTIHVESSCDVWRTLKQIRALGVRQGVAVNPETPLAVVRPFIGEVDEILCMTVHPGFGGQKFLPEVLPKITALRQASRSAPGQGRGGGSLPDIAVDGGIDLDTVAQVAGAGANIMVAGSCLFQAADMEKTIAEMRAGAEKAWCAGLVSRRPG